MRYIDLPVYGSPMPLSWKKHRMRCVNVRCAKASWVLCDHRIAAKKCLLTTRRPNRRRASRRRRTVKEVAAELACDWHTVNDAVCTYGEALLEADRKRLNKTSAIGLDETSFMRQAEQADYATTVADVEHHQILDILPSRKYIDVAAWLDKQPKAWKERIRFGALDMSTTYAAVYSVMLPQAAQVVDPFHVISLANRSLDAIRRRVQIEQSVIGVGVTTALSRPPVLLRAREAERRSLRRLASLLELGDPGAEVAIAYRVKERLRDFYRTCDPHLAHPMLLELQTHCTQHAMPPEIQHLGRTIKNWFDKIVNFHLARVSNGPTESLNNLIKRIKRSASGSATSRTTASESCSTRQAQLEGLGSIVVR